MAPNGDIYLPWTLGEAAASVYRLTLAYLIAGGLLLLLWLVTPRAAADVPAGD
jgi:hypothetical protein